MKKNVMNWKKLTKVRKGINIQNVFRKQKIPLNVMLRNASITSLSKNKKEIANEKEREREKKKKKKMLQKMTETIKLRVSI